jgi:glycosyltransferase involved in cell wall biosynthesis
VFGADRGGVEGALRALITAWNAVEHVVLLFGENGPMVSDWRSIGATVEIRDKGEAGWFQFAKNLRRALQRLQPAAVVGWFGMVRLPQIIHVCNRLDLPLTVNIGNPARKLSTWTNWRFIQESRLYPPQGPLPLLACCSKYVEGSLASSDYLRGFPATTIYTGINFPQATQHVPRPLDSKKPFTIGMTARLNKIKDHVTLLHAFKNVVSVHPNAILELAGDGEMREELESLASELAIGERVIFLGTVSDIYLALSRWDMFVFSTTEQEGLGNALSEAMAFGLPCVVSDVGPMREFLGHPETIRLAISQDSLSLSAIILDLMEDQEARLSLSCEAMKFARDRFGLSTYSARYRDSLFNR